MKRAMSSQGRTVISVGLSESATKPESSSSPMDWLRLPSRDTSVPDPGCGMRMKAERRSIRGGVSLPHVRPPPPHPFRRKTTPPRGSFSARPRSRGGERALV